MIISIEGDTITLQQTKEITLKEFGEIVDIILDLMELYPDHKFKLKREPEYVYIPYKETTEVNPWKDPTYPFPNWVTYNTTPYKIQTSYTETFCLDTTT